MKAKDLDFCDYAASGLAFMVAVPIIAIGALVSAPFALIGYLGGLCGLEVTKYEAEDPVDSKTGWDP